MTAELSEGVWNLALQPPKTLYLRYHNAYDYQTTQGDYLAWRAPLHKVTQPLITLPSEITWQTKTMITLLQRCLWPINLTGWWLTMRSSYPKSHMNLWSRALERSRDKLKPLCIQCHSVYGHKLVRVVTCHKGLLSIKLLEPLIRWSYKITWLTKTIISPLPECAWLPNLVAWWLTLQGF